VESLCPGTDGTEAWPALLDSSSHPPRSSVSLDLATRQRATSCLCYTRYDGAKRLTVATRQADPLVGIANNSSPNPATLLTAPQRESFTYDVAQNLVERMEVTEGIAEEIDLPIDSSGRNRPASIDGTVLQWDANGNLVARGDQQLYYDYRNRLTRVDDAQGNTIAIYTYDAFNRRVKKVVGAEVTETVWDEWRSVEDYDNGQLTSRRVHGLGLDEAIQMETDLDGDGILDQDLIPIYDSTGNLALVSDEQGKPIERYRYNSYGEQTIYADLTAPEVEQLRVVGDDLWLEISEEVLGQKLQEALVAGKLRLVEAATSNLLDLTVSQPIQEGRQAGQRVVLTLSAAPSEGTELELTVEPEGLVDPFHNQLATTFQQSFTWPAADSVILDTAAPRLEAVRVKAGILEIELSEEPDLTSLATAITLDGQSTSWTASVDGSTLVADSPLTVGAHHLEIGTALLDLDGQALPETSTFDFEHQTGPPDQLIFEATDPRQVSLSATGNHFGFKGLPRDTENGLLYVRNRYFDPALGLFISADPLGYIDGPSMYQFSGADPLNQSDPLGLTARSDIPQDLAYTWNFGWFDYGHGAGHHKELELAWWRLQKADPGEVLRFSLGIKQYWRGHFLYRESLLFFQIEAAATIEERKRQLLYAFQLASEDFEEYQDVGVQGIQWINSLYGGFKGEQQKIATSYSTEDIFSNLVTFLAVVDDTPPEELLQLYGGEIDPEDREEFSLLIWDLLLQPKEHGAQGWAPVLIDPQMVPTPDEFMRARGISPHVPGYEETKRRFSQKIQRLNQLIEKYENRYGKPTLPQSMTLEPLQTGVSIELLRRF